jgi:hypothetical protein
MSLLQKVEHKEKERKKRLGRQPVVPAEATKACHSRGGGQSPTKLTALKCQEQQTKTKTKKLSRAQVYFTLHQDQVSFIIRSRCALTRYRPGMG